MSLRRSLLYSLIIASASTLGCHRDTAEASGIHSAPANPPGTTGVPGLTATGSPGDAGMVNDAGIVDGPIGSRDGGSDAGAVSDGGYPGLPGRDAGR